MVRKAKSVYPTELVAKAEFEMETFERVSAETAAELIAEVKALRTKLNPGPKMKTVINLMSGEPIQIAENTPRCCDPSSELYWSM